MNVRQKEPSASRRLKPLVGDNVEIDIIDEDEKDGKRSRNPATEKCADPAGSGKCRSGTW